MQEVEIKTGAYGAEYGKSTGGIFNVITKSGTNEFHGDCLCYFITEEFGSRDVKNFRSPVRLRTASPKSTPASTSAVQSSKTSFGSLVRSTRRRRKNFFLTQTFLQEVENEVTTPFYAGKITWGSIRITSSPSRPSAISRSRKGFLFGVLGLWCRSRQLPRRDRRPAVHNYAFRLNSTFIQTSSVSSRVDCTSSARTPFRNERRRRSAFTDNFAILTGAGSIAAATTTNIQDIRCIDTDDDVDTPCENLNFGQIAFVEGSGGSLQRNFVRRRFWSVSVPRIATALSSPLRCRTSGASTPSSMVSNSTQHLQHRHPLDWSGSDLR